MPSSYLLLNGLRIHYLRWSDGVGVPVVLLHDLGANARTWELVVPALQAAGFSPLAPDARGHGLSDRPDSGYDFDTLRRDLAAFLDAANLERPVLVGHGWGACLALDYAARISFGPRAPSALVLVDGALVQADGSGPSWDEFQRRFAPPLQDSLPISRLLEHFADPRRPWQPDEQTLPLILANYEIYEPDPDGSNHAPNGSSEPEEIASPRLPHERHLQILRLLWEFKPHDHFRQVRCPVLILPAAPTHDPAASDDPWTALKARGLEQAQQTLPHLQFHWLPDTAPEIPLHRPAALAARLIPFIQSLHP